MRDLANPLQNLIAKASTSLVKTTGETARAARRVGDPGAPVVILCDTSGSMDEAAGCRRKIDHLREALESVWGSGPVLVFSSSVSRLDALAHLPAPSGGTALHLGLDAAGELRPRKTIVISDGQPDSEADALTAADRLPGAIDVIYCGPDSDALAVAFMRRLARAGGGTVVVHDLRRTQELLPVRRLMLGVQR
jgi:Mg-chelatase subunit ChlD